MVKSQIRVFSRYFSCRLKSPISPSATSAVSPISSLSSRKISFIDFYILLGFYLFARIKRMYITKFFLKPLSLPIVFVSHKRIARRISLRAMKFKYYQYLFVFKIILLRLLRRGIEQRKRRNLRKGPRPFQIFRRLR